MNEWRFHAKMRSRSRNKRRNLWVGWCGSSGRPWFWSVSSIYYHIHTMYYSWILSNWNKLFPRDTYMPRVGVAMAVCWMIWYCYSFLLGLKSIFQLYSSRFSISWYGYGYYVTLCIGQLHPHHSIYIYIYMTVFWGGALFWYWVLLCDSFTSSLIEFFFIMIVVTIIEIFMAIFFILNSMFRLSVTK